MTDITELRTGDTVRLTGDKWAEIEKISPITFEGIPQAGEEYVIMGGSVLGPYFEAYGTWWPVNDFYTADKVTDADATVRQLRRRAKNPKDEMIWTRKDDSLLLSQAADRIEELQDELSGVMREWGETLDHLREVLAEREK